MSKIKQVDALNNFKSTGSKAYQLF